MSWSQEVLRAIYVAFGAIEIITNGSYLVRPDGMKYAKKQHGELPSKASEKNVRVKVICMLLVGLIFFVSGLTCYIVHGYVSIMLKGSAVILVGYSFVEACYYRYWKTMGFACVSGILFAAILLTFPNGC